MCSECRAGYALSMRITPASLMLMLMLVLVLACTPDLSCPEGQLLQGDGSCVAYTPDPPVEPPTEEEIFRPAPGTSWQWQLSGTIDTSPDVQMYDIDLFDAPQAVIDELSAAGRTVICYFSAGSHEDWREDAARFPDEAIGRQLDGWPGERWLDIRSDEVRRIMSDRLDRAVERGCDGVEPDNVDGWSNQTGFSLTQTEQLDYNRFLADAAHERGLSVGLKNDLGDLQELLDWFDWGLNEECASYQECGRLGIFTGAGKAVFHVEYVDRLADGPQLAEEVCGVGPQLDTLIKTWDVGPEFLPCP